MVQQIIQARTKREIRTSVSYNVLGQSYIVSTCTANGTANTLVDTALVGGADDKNGSWVIFRSGTDDGTIVRVTDDDGSGTLTFAPAVNIDSVASGDAYELFPDSLDPKMIHSFMDDAILDVTGRVFDPEEDLSLHLYPDRLRYDIPTQFAMINRLEERVSVRNVPLTGTQAVWGTIHANVTASVDSEVQLRGGSLKLVTGSQADGDVLAQETISSVNISRYTHLEFQIRCTTTLVAGDLEIVLSDAGGEEERLTVAAVGVAANWEIQRIALATPENDTEITIIAVEANHASNVDDKTIWVEDFRVVDNDSADWQRINKSRYLVETQSRDLVFKGRPRYGLLKIIGGDKPALFTGETTASEVDDWFVICYTTAAILGVLSDGSTNDSRKLGLWQGRTEQAKGGFPPLINARKLS